MENIKEIIEDLDNPFEINRFINLLNMYMNSQDWNDFYRSVVTYYPNSKQIEGLAANIKEINDFVTKEGMDSYIKYEYFSNFFPTEHRVYINSPIDINKEFVELFISKCINKNIPFELKYAIERTNRSDGIVIGGNSAVFLKQIEILRGIAKEHPEYIERCETPHLLTASLDGWMGIADENVDNRFQSYTQSRLGLIISTCKKFILGHPEYKDEISGYDILLEEYNNKKRNIEDGVKKGRIPETEKDISISRELARNFVYWSRSKSHSFDLNGTNFGY